MFRIQSWILTFSAPWKPGVLLEPSLGRRAGGFALLVKGTAMADTALSHSGCSSMDVVPGAGAATL